MPNNVKLENKYSLSVNMSSMDSIHDVRCKAIGHRQYLLLYQPLLKILVGNLQHCSDEWTSLDQLQPLCAVGIFLRE